MVAKVEEIQDNTWVNEKRLSPEYFKALEMARIFGSASSTKK